MKLLEGMGVLHKPIDAHCQENNIAIMLKIELLLRSSISKWFEPRSISSSYCVIVWVRVVLKRTVVGD